ncbi:MAG: hypothetical protein AAB037_03925, partial [Chloroflexota bacterium]
RGWAIAVAAIIGTLLLIGIPTVIVPNPFFTRIIPVRPQDYIIWMATGIMVGLIAGTFFTPLRKAGQGKIVSGGLLSFLAVGCPVCNKLVVLLLGFSGALTFFAPVQLYIGLASLVILGWAFRQRVRALSGSCDIRYPDS